MRRGLILLVGVMVLALTPALVCAQFGGMPGISGLPGFGGFFGSGSGCGAGAATPAIAPSVYFGWMPEQENNVSAGLDAQNLGAWNIRTVNLKYRTGGFWLGGIVPVQLTEKVSFLGSGWYLFPSDSSAGQMWENGEIRQVAFNYGNDWTKKDIWWFVDGVLAYGDSNFSVLAGLRYDKFSTNYSGANINFNNGQQLDLIAQSIIPLLGVQAGYKSSASSLNVRIVGIPTNAGNAKVNFTVANNNRLEATGNYNGGHFLEVFAEYARQIFQNGDAGVFLRWNTTRVTSDVSATTTQAPTTDDYLLSFNRNTWTLGGKVGISF